jgi:hypothetical protein
LASAGWEAYFWNKERKTKNKKLKKIQKKKKVNSGKITRELFQFIRRRKKHHQRGIFSLIFARLPIS